MVIERTHRVKKCRYPFHLADGTKVKSRPRPIVAKFLSWKDKDRVLRSARSVKPDGIQFLEDFNVSYGLIHPAMGSQNLSMNYLSMRMMMFHGFAYAARY